MRRTYVYDEKLGRMVEKSVDMRAYANRLTIMPDLPDFVSPIDGKVVNGRRGLREHNRTHNVTNTSDYTNEWAQKAKARESFLGGKRDESRAQAIAQAFDRHSHRR